MAFSLSRQTVKQAAIIIAVTSIMSQGLGVLRESLIANFLGTSADYDILLIAIALPMMMANILFVAVPSSGIPHFQPVNGNKAAKSKPPDTLFIGVNSIVIAVASLAVFFALPLAKGILARGLNSDQLDKFVLFGRIFCILIPIRVYEAVFRALLQFRHNFLFPAMTIIGFNITVIVILVSLFPSLGAPAYLMAWILGSFAETLVVVIPSYFYLRKEKEHDAVSSFDSGAYLRYLGIICMVESVGLIVDPFDRYLAGGFLSSGFVSANTYAMIVSMVPIRIFIYSIGTAIFPTLAAKAVDNKEEASRIYHRALAICLVVIIPVSAYFLFFSSDLIRILFQRGRFDARSTAMTVQVLRFYLAGMVIQACFLIQMKMIYAVKSWKFLVVSRILALAVKVIMGFSFIQSNWALALGGGTILMFALNFALLEIHIVRKLGMKYSRKDMGDFSKAILLAFVMLSVIIITVFGVRKLSFLGGVGQMAVAGFLNSCAGMILEMKFRFIGLLSKKPGEA